LTGAAFCGILRSSPFSSFEGQAGGMGAPGLVRQDPSINASTFSTVDSAEQIAFTGSEL